MIKVRVKTIWQGKVGVRDIYVKQAKEEQKDLMIQVGHDYMRIPLAEIDDRIVCYSEKPVVDYFSKEKHYLVYFWWKPETEQGALALAGV